MNEDELRRMLHETSSPGHGPGDWAGTAVRAGRRRRAVRRAAGTASVLVLVVAAVAGAQAVPRFLADPAPPASSPTVEVTATPDPDPAPEPTGSATPPAPATSASDASVPLLVSADGGVSLHRVAPGSTEAVRERDLTAPDAARSAPVAMALSGGEQPLACVVWQLSDQAQTDITEELACYPSGSSEPVVVDLPEGVAPTVVALRADASQLAVADHSPDGAAPVLVADLDADLSPSWRSYGPGAVEGFTPVQGLAFAGTTPTLLLTVQGATPDRTGLRSLDLTTDDATWGALDPLVPAAGAGTYERVVTAADATALVVLDDRPDDAVPAVAVQVVLADGSVRSTVAHPGRDVVSASGTPAATVYQVVDREVGQAAGDEAVSTFLVRAGETQGVPLTGLPASPYVGVVAGPGS